MESQDQKFYDILLDIKGRLGGIENDLSSHKDTHDDIKELLKAHSERMNTHAGKINDLEDFKKGVKSKVATISMIFGVVSTIGFNTIKKWFI
jgi:chromosome segregation ATPase